MSLKQMYEKETGKKWYIDSNYTKNTSFTSDLKFYAKWLESILYNECFKNLISEGYNPNDYMYMCSDDKFDYFQHIATRDVLKILL